MVTTIIVILISLVILMIYVGGLLAFTPDRKDDKYIISILKVGFRYLDNGKSRKFKLYGTLEFHLGYLIILFAYKILDGRKYAEIKA